jgi:hypothetical protein
MENVVSQPGLQSPTLGYGFHQNMEKVALPSGSQSFALGYCYNQYMGTVAYRRAC